MSAHDLPAVVSDKQRGINAIISRDVTPEQVALITRTVANGATPDELKLYLYDCQRRGVHPLDRLIHFTKRGGKYTPITGIDFMRTRAHESGDCAGIGDPEFSGDQASAEFTARCTVKRIVRGIVCDFTATARWSEYYPGDQGGHMWRKMPHVMLGKCAEALALRKAFPQELAGLYAREEMDQAGPEPVVRDAGPPPAARTGRGVSAAVEVKAAAALDDAVAPEMEADSIAEAVEAARPEAQGQPMLDTFIAACRKVEASTKRSLLREHPAKSGALWFVDKELCERTLTGTELPGSVHIANGAAQVVSDNRLSRLLDAVQGLAEQVGGRSK